MASEIKLPELGENLEGGEVVAVKVGAGDSVQEGQTLLEVEAEKSTVEVPAPMAGNIAKILIQVGDHIKVGQSLFLVEEGEAKKSTPAKKKPAEPEEDTAESSEVEESKEPQKDQEKQVAKKEAKKPEKADGKQVEKQEAKKPEKVDGKHLTPVPAPSQEDRLAPAGPATRMLARQLGVDLGRVRGTGLHGRISQDDVKAFVRDQLSNEKTTGSRPALPDFERWGPIERRPLEPIPRRMAEHMSLAWAQIPHVTQYDQADITDLDGFRKEEKGEPKLTVTAFALKAVALALAEFPVCNSSLDAAAGQLILKKYYHIGVAVDTDHGLLVPVLRDVDKKGVRRLAGELADLAGRARNKKLTAEEMRGGTFTITNLGGIGGTAFTPIINYPEVAILGLSRARLEPVVRAGQVTPRLMLTLSLSYDHRVIDGATAARFTRRLAEFLENPLRMLL
jgi:pyruvate dehydrogenase E2 component (dihydrolipoamide acetyltransferase)